MDGVPATAALTVTHATAANVSLTPISAVITAGQSITYTTTATDTYGNSWNATSTASYTITPAAGGSWNNNIYTSQFANLWTVTSTVDTIPDLATLTVNAATPQTVTVQVYSSTLIARSGATSPITVTVVDAFSNRVPGVPLTSTLPVTLGTVSLSGTTNLSGQSFGTWTAGAGTTVGSGMLQVGAGTAVGTAPVTLTFGAATTITVQVNPATLIANSGATATVTATVVDTYSNPVANATLTATVPFTMGTVSNLGATNPSGQAFGTWNPGGSAAHRNSLLSVSNGSLTGTAPITLTADVPSNVMLQPAVSSTVVTSTYIGLTAVVKDQFGNSVADGTTVTFTRDLGDLQYQQRTTISGVAFSGIRSTQAGTALITATSGSAWMTTTVTFVPDIPYSITLQANPISLTVGNNSVLTATVYDQYHNVVSGTITVTFTRSLGNLSPTVVTTTNGVATSQISDTLAGPRFITATTQPPALAGTTTVTFTPDVPFTVTLTAQPTTQTVGNNSVLTATVTDQYSNRVTNGTLVTFTASQGNVVSPVPTTNGIATSLISDTQAGPEGSLRIITATSGLAQPATTTVTFMPDVPISLTLQAYPVTQTVGNSSVLTATVYDRLNNRVANGTTVTFTHDLTGSIRSPVTTTNGIATSQVTVTLAGTVRITATSGTAWNTTFVTFTPDVPYSLTLQAYPITQTVGNNSVLTATVYDRFNNRVANGTTVTFTTNLGNVGSPRTTTNGVATSAVSSTLVGTARITATSGAAWNTTLVTFTPDVPYSLTLQAYPVTQTVGNNSVLTATVCDRFNNRVANGTTVTFTHDLTGSIRSPVTTTNGIATSQVTVTLAGTVRITATSGTAWNTTFVTFTPDVPYSLTLQAYPITQTVGNNSVLTATVYDRFNNRVANGTTVTFTTNLGNVGSPRTTTNGVATSAVSSTLVGTARITATSGAAWQTTLVTFTHGAATTVTVQVNPPNLIANSSATATITATVVDLYSNPVPGVVLTGSVPITLGTVSGLGATNANGQAFGIWTAGTTRGSGLLRVGNGVITGTAAIALLLSNPQTVTVQVVSPTLFANSGMTTTVIATVRDAYNNLIPNAVVNWSLSPPALGSVNPSAITDESGRAYNVWTAGGMIGSGQVIANAGSAGGSAAITLTADVPYTLTLQANPTSPIAGVGSALTAIVSDRFSNPVANGTPVTFTSSSGTVLSPMTTINGVASSYLNWTGVGTVYITATTGSVERSISVNFLPNTPASLTLQAYPVSPTVGHSSMLTATVRDQYSNLVADGTLVTFTTTLGSVTSPATTLQGLASSSVSSTRSGTAHITVTSGSAQNSIIVTFEAGPPVTITAELSTLTLTVNSGATAAITATVVDTYTNPVPGVTPTISISPTTLGNPSFQGPTNENGQAFGTWRAGTVIGSGVLVVGDNTFTVTVLPRQVFLPLLMRDFPSIPVGQWVKINGGAANTFQITVSLEVSATVSSDYVEWMRFSNDNVHWSNWMTFAPTTTWILDSNNGLARVYAQFKGHQGGISSAISSSILLFKNGDFAQPDLASWSRDPGNALSVSGANEPGSFTNPAGLLGNPAYVSCNPGANVPIGYGSIFQSLIMPDVPTGKRLVLKFNYHIYTSDLNMQLIDGYDRFDVLLGGNRVFSDMNQNPSQGPSCSTVYDLGRKEAVIPVTGSPGSILNVTFRLYNLPDHLYNTYVYLDNVRLEFQYISSYATETFILPETHDGRAGR